jgi:hypothetical protein
MRDPFEDLMESFRPGIIAILDELCAANPGVKRQKLEVRAKELWAERQGNSDASNTIAVEIV